MNFIFEYYQAIKTGTVAAGEWLRLFYEMIVNGLDEGRFLFEPKLATRAIKFIENFGNTADMIGMLMCSNNIIKLIDF